MPFDVRAVTALRGAVVGRERETELLIAALGSGAHVLLEGPPGTGKSTLLRSVASAAAVPFAFVEGNAELTPARLAGHFDPARVITEGYSPDVFVDGPLVEALRAGALLYVEEINRIPEETLNLLITVMSEGELHLPRLGTVRAADGFRLVAAMNPFDTIGTARISSAVYDRVCRLSMGYQDEVAEAIIAVREAKPPQPPDPAWVDRVVEVVRRTRAHPEIRVGSSVRGAIDIIRLAASLADLRGRTATGWRLGLDATLVALSGRLQLHDSAGREHHPRALRRRVRGGAGGQRAADRRARRRGAAAAGKSPAPPGGGDPTVLEGDAAREALSEGRRRTVSREELERHDTFAQISPAIGELDKGGFEAALADDADDALALLPELVAATDERLRALARNLAGRVVLDRARRGLPTRAGIGRPRLVRADRPGADLDLDASLEPLVEARGLGRAADLADLQARDWGRAATAVCLVIDRSGSMAGDRLAAAAVAAAACAWRAPTDHAVLVFSGTVIAVKPMDRPRDAVAVVDDLLTLRGKGTTDLAAALAGAAAQLARSRARRKVCVLLSDCQFNRGSDPVAAASAIDELIVVGPTGDAEAETFSRRAGARSAVADGPSETVAALAALLG